MASLYDYNGPFEPQTESATERLMGGMEFLPGATVTAGWMANRARRTIINGGRTRTGIRRRLFTQADLSKKIHPVFLNPFSWGKYPHVEMFNAHPFMGGAEKGAVHTPFGVTQMANSFHRKFLGSTMKFGGEAAAPLFTPGYAGIVGAAGNISKLTADASGMVNIGSKRAANIGRFLNTMDMPIPLNSMPITAGAGAADGAVLIEKNYLMQAMLGSGSGTLSGAMGGFMAGAAAPGEMINPALRGAVSRPFKRGFYMAQKFARDTEGGVGAAYRRTIAKAGAEGVEGIAKHRIFAGIAGKSAALKLGAAAPRMLGVASGISNVLFVYEMAKLAGNLANKFVIKPALNLTRDAMHSYIGSLDKPIMGGGFRDTEATATMRQRGVMAIQNSRLNARSMLGNEAGMAYSHFG